MHSEYDVLGGYIPSFVQHLKDTSARLGLRAGSQVDKGRTDAGGATETRTPSDWTPAEHDTLFRAISVHSRWRPDLIAACVSTKADWEVWMYLEALEEGVATLSAELGDEDVDMEDSLVDVCRDMEMQVDESTSESRSHSGSDMDEDEGGCEPALEVSQAWIDAEEYMASWIIDGEHLASVEGDATDDTQGVDDKPPKRKRGRPPGTRKRHARGLATEEAMSTKSSPSPVHRPPSHERTLTPARKRSRDPSFVPAQKRDTLMRHLEVPHLQVLDSILREGPVTMATLTEHGDDGAPRVHGVVTSSLSNRITEPLGTSNIPESSSSLVTGPARLAQFGDPADQLHRIPREGPATFCAAAQGSSSLLNASSQLTSCEASTEPTFPQCNATPTRLDPNTDAEPESSLTPRSRRRIQKRLYMRRKRALLREDGVAPEGVVDTGIEKLKPGKKAKSERGGTSVPCSSAPPDEAGPPENLHKNKPGLTLPYKLKAHFTESGIDAAYLRGQGMDLLNLGALGKLMRLYSSLGHDGEADGLAIVESIDAQLIRHLQAAMVSFVMDVMHRAIVWREREVRMKQRSRVWRHGDQFTISAVKHAIEAIGTRYHSHKTYFKSLEAFYGLSAEGSSITTNGPGSTAPLVDSDAGTEDLLAESSGLSPHRDVYTPLVCPPSTWKMGPLACLTRTYEQDATRTRRGTSAEIEEDELIPDETDEEALEAELEEEAAVDALDMQLSAAYERDLWDRVQRNK